MADTNIEFLNNLANIEENDGTDSVYTEYYPALINVDVSVRKVNHLVAKVDTLVAEVKEFDSDDDSEVSFEDLIFKEAYPDVTSSEEEVDVFPGYICKCGGCKSPERRRDKNGDILLIFSKENNPDSAVSSKDDESDEDGNDSDGSGYDSDDDEDDNKDGNSEKIMQYYISLLRNTFDD